MGHGPEAMGHGPEAMTPRTGVRGVHTPWSVTTTARRPWHRAPECAVSTLRGA